MEKKHVLIVDDDLILLKTAEEILSEFYSVSVAKAGEPGDCTSGKRRDPGSDPSGYCYAWNGWI